MGRGRWVVKLILLTLAATVVASLGGETVASAAEEAPDDEAGFRALINRERAGHGLSPLVEAQGLLVVARRHSDRMASRDEVFHNPDLASEVDDWQLLGENVGAGVTVRDIHDALMDSKVHRDVILQPRFTETGIGVLRVGESIWVTQVFRQPEARPEPSPATTAPARAQAAAEPPRDGDPAPPAPARVAGTQSGRSVEGAAHAATDVNAAQDTALGRPVIIDASSSPLAASRLSRPGPTSIPGPGVVAAALLLAVVGSASLAQPKRAAV